MKYWLFKTEPDVFSIDHLKQKGITHWEGVRNYQARNYLRDQVKKGDLVLFYHSSTTPPGVAGIACVCREAYPDFTAQDPKSLYYDPKATPENPIWHMVDVEFVEKFPTYVSLEDLKNSAELGGMLVCRRGMRLSIQPVIEPHFHIVKMMGTRRV